MELSDEYKKTLLLIEKQWSGSGYWIESIYKHINYIKDNPIILWGDNVLDSTCTSTMKKIPSIVSPCYIFIMLNDKYIDLIKELLPHFTVTMIDSVIDYMVIGYGIHPTIKSMFSLLCSYRNMRMIGGDGLEFGELL